MPDEQRRRFVYGVGAFDGNTLARTCDTVNDMTDVSDNFPSTGHRRAAQPRRVTVRLTDEPLPPLLDRIAPGRYFVPDGEAVLAELLAAHPDAAPTLDEPPTGGTSAGKNTYTYDAHTYHTKVPPQGIAALLKRYLPGGGLVLDPFAGSGMTGVAAQVLGYDCVLNELSPAACFIARQFTTHVEPVVLRAALKAVLAETMDIRRQLYTTHRPDTGEAVEAEHVVWSNRVICNLCGHEFTLWDACRQYGRGVRQHRILSRFPCPACGQMLNKRVLKRTTTVPVAVAVKRGARSIELHAPDAHDLDTIARTADIAPAEGFYPRMPLTGGVNLRQPIKQGIVSVDAFYTRRNLIAMSYLWRTIHRIADAETAAFLAFVFTSLYQRVTRFSEFRFWGGSGNTAHFNVPHIAKEANVFTTFERKAHAVLDHLEATAAAYRGRTLVINGSAARLDMLPDESVDLIFTDPPFGANINYSEMNIIWEAWLGRFTDTRDEAIISKHQHKTVAEYGELMRRSLRECARVLRDGHWMLLVFMNSSEAVWDALRHAINDAGFSIVQVDIFDKQHSTFKQLVHENTAGADVVLHCRKGTHAAWDAGADQTDAVESIARFLSSVDITRYRRRYLHVKRPDEIDYRMLYSEWVAQTLAANGSPIGYPAFRTIAAAHLHDTASGG